MNKEIHQYEKIEKRIVRFSWQRETKEKEKEREKQEKVCFVCEFINTIVYACLLVLCFGTRSEIDKNTLFKKIFLQYKIGFLLRCNGVFAKKLKFSAKIFCLKCCIYQKSIIPLPLKSSPSVKVCPPHLTDSDGQSTPFIYGSWRKRQKCGNNDCQHLRRTLTRCK